MRDKIAEAITDEWKRQLFNEYGYDPEMDAEYPQADDTAAAEKLANAIMGLLRQEPTVTVVEVQCVDPGSATGQDLVRFSGMTETLPLPHPMSPGTYAFTLLPEED